MTDLIKTVPSCSLSPRQAIVPPGLGQHRTDRLARLVFIRGEAGLCHAPGPSPSVSVSRLDGLGKLKVALDLRDLPREHVGTRTYAFNLARELARLPELELTLLVEHPAQARGMSGRVIASAAWADDVALIHKPAQVMDPAELPLLFDSNAHLVITYQDLIAYRIPLVFASETSFETYRATSRLVLPAVQRLIAYSSTAGAEIAAEFGIPPDEIAVVMLAADPEAGAEPRDPRGRLGLRLPKRYFFSLASDYPHKNLPDLLDAYSRFRKHWTQGEPPALVLAGYASGARTALYPQLELHAAPKGVIFLGPVSPRQLRTLYKQADALVFASLYEGFGLPPLEAMAIGTPVIAMPIAPMTEVCSDGALYAEGLSALALSRALERVAASAELRAALRDRGRERVQNFGWEKTARATCEVYFSTVLHPGERSLRMRRTLREAIIDWSAKNSRHGACGSSSVLGIRAAYRALDVAVRARIRRELRRYWALPLVKGQ